MRKRTIFLGVLCLVFVFGFIGCAPKPTTANSKEAIAQAKGLETVEDQAQYLIGEAKAFISSKKFQESVNIAQYVLSNLDKNSTDAKSLLEKAKAGLKVEVEKRVEEAKKEFKGKIDALGK